MKKQSVITVPAFGNFLNTTLGGASSGFNSLVSRSVNTPAKVINSNISQIDSEGLQKKLVNSMPSSEQMQKRLTESMPESVSRGLDNFNQMMDVAEPENIGQIADNAESATANVRDLSAGVLSDYAKLRGYAPNVGAAGAGGLAGYALANLMSKKDEDDDAYRRRRNLLTLGGAAAGGLGYHYRDLLRSFFNNPSK